MRHSRQPYPTRVLSVLAAFGLSGLMHIGAAAQSLPELYAAARSYDAAYQAAKAQAESAKFRAAQADARLLPNVGLSAGVAQTETSSPVPPSGANDRRGLSTVQAGLKATQPLYNPGYSVSIEQARRSLDLSLSDLEIAEQDLIVRVAQSYFDVLAAQDSLTTAQTNKRAISEQLASAKRNFEVGTATITDTREAQARFDLAGAQELFAENDLLSKRITLDVIVGRSNVKPLALLTPVALPGVVPADVNAWVSAGDALHPGVRKARLALEIATLDTAKARSDIGPTVDLSGSFGTSRNTGSGAIPAAGNSLQAKLEVVLAMPLYSGGALQNRVRETLALEEKSRNEFDAARRSVAQTTRVAYFGLQSLHAQVKALEAAESSSQLALEATQLGYKVGVRVNLDVLNAQTQLFTTKRDLAKARYDVVLNGLKLRQASGQLQPGDVNAVDRLFRK